ncbi:hypothetical protein LSAT2_012117, partial [Lamellibrachia satsuma]
YVRPHRNFPNVSRLEHAKMEICVMTFCLLTFQATATCKTPSPAHRCAVPVSLRPGSAARLKNNEAGHDNR